MSRNQIRNIASVFSRRRGAARRSAPRAVAPAAAPSRMFEAMESRVLFAGSGLSATYFDNPDFTGRSVSRVDARVNFDWQANSPVAGISPDTYSVRWTGQVEPRYSDTYTFHTTGNDGIRLWVNGQMLVDDWNTHTATENTGRITLQAGKMYDIRMEYFQNYNTALAKLEWSSAKQPRQVIPTDRLYPAGTSTPKPIETGTGTGLQAEYFNNPDFTGFVAGRVDSTVNFDWQANSPVAGVAPDTYSVRWTGQVQPRHSETYTFHTTGNDGIRLWVNGQRLVDDWNTHAATENTGRITLEAGKLYDLRMEYFQNYNTALAKLEWSSTSQARQVIPTARLYPAAAPTTPPDPTIPPTIPPIGAGTGTGLRAAYYNNQDFTGFVTDRVDSTVNFDWQANSPVAGVAPDTYSVRWTGQVQPRYSDTYTFHTTGNDGIRLWVNGQMLVDDWNSHAATENSGRITLEAGKLYDLRMEYYQNYNTALAKLEWSSAGQPRQVIPSTQLYPAAGPEVPPDPIPEPVPVPNPGGVVPPIAGNWKMIFQDEFSGSTLDPVWHTAQYWDNDYTIVGYGEQQVYDKSAVSVSNGMLNLTARKETKHGMPYVSGLVQTGGNDWVSNEPRFSFKYGYMEVRAKLPAGQGLWPAIWMMPASYNDGNGELDVLEVLGHEPNVAYFNLHRNGRNDGEDWVGPDFSKGFHTFGVDWQPDHVSWYVDGVERARMTDPALICPEAMYPILNVAVGGDWPGAPDASTPFPATMQVDYVRVWQDA